MLIVLACQTNAWACIVQIVNVTYTIEHYMKHVELVVENRQVA